MMKRLAALAATIALILAGEAGAAEWPIKPVKIVVALCGRWRERPAGAGLRGARRGPRIRQSTFSIEA
jgi:hypothetical protein